jgi:hypothetical protein
MRKTLAEDAQSLPHFKERPMKRRMIALAFVALLVLACGAMVRAEGPIGDVVNNVDSDSVSDGIRVNLKPQNSVVCLGLHALCDFSTDCRVIGDEADCACWKVDEPYIVETNKIQDPQVKALTQRACTASHPCDMDQAPVCKAIRSGQYKVEGVKYPWVSTFSYRGWCENWNPVPCAAAPWADCMAAPCTMMKNPEDPDRPLSCQCRVQNSAFIGTQGSGDPGKVMSTIPKAAWNFKKNMYTVPFPGYEYVKGACAPLQSEYDSRIIIRPDAGGLGIRGATTIIGCKWSPLSPDTRPAIKMTSKRMS